MDGVLVDGEPLHFAAVNELMAAEGKAITLEQYKPYMGTKAGWSDMVRDFGLSEPREFYTPRYHELILRQYRERAEPIDGASCLVLDLSRRQVPLSVASSSIRPWVDACLKRIALDHVFDAIVTGSDVSNGKPDPEIYLKAAQTLGVKPADCLAVEDAPAGIASAKAAGMTCWAVRTEYTRGLDLGRPDNVFESLRDIDVDEIVKVAA
jgi:HAD superfamily hydrolase (TIGR01509 family)